MCFFYLISFFIITTIDGHVSQLFSGTYLDIEKSSSTFSVIHSLSISSILISCPFSIFSCTARPIRFSAFAKRSVEKIAHVRNNSSQAETFLSD